MAEPINPFSQGSIVRIVVDLLGDELATSRGRALDVRGWNEATRLDGGGLDLDSLERLNVSAALNEFFHLHEHGAEDYLLGMASIGEYCDLVAQSLAATGQYLTFRTSGSTGVPKRCTHAIADLMVEVDGWIDRLGSIEQVVGLVPAHHIYGTIFTALLPDRAAVDCVAGRFSGASAVSNARPGSVVVATPTLWAYVSRSLLAFPQKLTGVSSTAPLSAHLAHQLLGQRLDRLIEVYGSSETGGVAWRSDSTAAFTLLGHWRHAGGDTITRLGADGAAMTHSLMDESAWLDDRRFALNGRRDGAVQIGGHNVFPERVRQRLLAHAGVGEAAVRLDGAAGRLKAFVVPAGDHPDADGLVEALGDWCADLRDVERPRHIAIGAALPRNGLGKLADW